MWTVHVPASRRGQMGAAMLAWGLAVAGLVYFSLSSGPSAPPAGTAVLIVGALFALAIAATVNAHLIKQGKRGGLILDSKGLRIQRGWRADSRYAWDAVLRFGEASEEDGYGAALPATRRYVGIMEEAIAEAAALPGALPSGEDWVWPTGARVLLVVCSEHGFSGTFNERLLDRAVELSDPESRLIVVGSRGADLARERCIAQGGPEAGDRNSPEILHSAGLEAIPMATHAAVVTAVARRLAEDLRDCGELSAVYGRHLGGGRYNAAERGILPLDPALMSGSRLRAPPVHYLSPPILLNRLAGEYLLAAITHTLMESLASENAARLQAMESADDNIADRLEGLRMDANRRRQEAITDELLDVVTGAEAVLRPR